MKPIISSCSTVLFATIFSLTLFLIGYWNRAENWSSDLRQEIEARPHEDSRIVLVVFDEAFAQAHAHTPTAFWSGEIAKVLDSVGKGKPKAIGLDFLFAVDVDEYLRSLGVQKEPNFALEQALVRNNPCVVARRTELNTLQTLAEAVEGRTGAVELRFEEDGISRAVVGKLNTGVAGFAYLLAKNSSAQATPAPPRYLGIRFSGRKFLSVPALQILKGTVDPAIYRDKVVLLGATHAFSQDIHRTPVGTLTGVELQGHAVATILDGNGITRLEQMQTVALLFALGLVTGLGAALTSRQFGPVIILTVALVYLIVSQWVFRSYSLDLPSFRAIAVLLMSGTSTWTASVVKDVLVASKLRAIFGALVSKKVADYLELNSIPYGREAKEVECTCLFLDIRNFTTFSEEIGPKKVVGILNTYFQTILPIIEEYGGHVSQFTGDGFLAVFGVPNPDPRHANHALAAARCILQATGGSEHTDLKKPLAVGIGIHTGPVIAELIGASNRHTFTVIGGVVNIASRLEGETKKLHCKLIYSQETATSAGQDTLKTRSETIPIRGLSGTMKIYCE